MSPRSATKRPFRISTVLARIRREVASYANAAMFELHERGHTTLFEQLVACIISIRTYDEVSLPAALRLFARARTPEAIAALGAPAVDRLIGDATFHEN